MTLVYQTLLKSPPNLIGWIRPLIQPMHQVLHIATFLICSNVTLRHDGVCSIVLKKFYQKMRAGYWLYTCTWTFSN